MADVRGFVGIDVGVLDDDLFAGSRGRFGSRIEQRRPP